MTTKTIGVANANFNANSARCRAKSVINTLLARKLLEKHNSYIVKTTQTLFQHVIHVNQGPQNSHVRCARNLKNAMLSTAWAVWHPAVFTFAAKHVMNARCVASCTETRDISSRTSNSARNVRCTNVMSARNPRLAPFLTKCTYTIGDTLSEICAASLVRFAPSARYQSL